MRDFEYEKLKQHAVEVTDMLRNREVGAFLNVEPILYCGPRFYEPGFIASAKMDGIYYRRKVKIERTEDYDKAAARLEEFLDEASVKRLSAKPEQKCISDYLVTAPRKAFKADAEIAADGYSPYSRPRWKGGVGL